MKLPKTFFGWSNFKWLIREFSAMYSNKDSYFSKKRFESSMSFMGAMSLVIGHALYNRATITNSEILADATLLFIISGYTVKQIQSEKQTTTAKPGPVQSDEPLVVEEPPIKDDDLVA
jgi:hypothetical protein